ncbi:MAG: serine hydrolase domain-containing protein [Alphaproteobacteria bacterium]
MTKFLTRVFVGALLIFSLIVTPAVADHMPDIMMRNFLAWSRLGDTGRLGPFEVNVATFGNRPDAPKTSAPNEVYSEFLVDKWNLASLVTRDGKFVHEYYNRIRSINSNTPLLGWSMSKTAVAASVGNLICEGAIKSIDDPVGAYSGFLQETAFNEVTIRNLLHMNSGVSPLGRANEKEFNRQARGMEGFEGEANIRDVLRTFDTASREQGETMNYHSTDTMTLSLLVEEISGVPLSQYFYDKIYRAFGQSNYMTWNSDASGTTTGFSDLVMTGRDWTNFGNYLMSQMDENTCLGSFFIDGIDNAVATGNPNGVRYGYQSWVYLVNGQPSLVLQGHGGQFMVLDQENKTILLMLSLNENYKHGNLFSSIHEFAEKLN